MAFCRNQHGRVVGLLSLYCGDALLAEELAQEALARVCRDWKKVQHHDDPQAWLYRVAINLANSFFRRKGAEKRAQARLAARGVDRSCEVDAATKVAVRSAVASLPRRQRSAVVLRYFADLSVRQTADLMGCPEGTVKTLTRKGLESLRAASSLADLREVSDVS